MNNTFVFPEGLYLVQGSKAGPTTYVNYDDVCYSTGEKNSPYYSMSHLPDWGLILCASSNGIEVLFHLSLIHTDMR